MDSKHRVAKKKRTGYHKGAVGMLQGRVGRQHRIVRFDDRIRQLRRGIHAELQFRLLPVVGREMF